jgi:hypothetical protein
MLYLNLFGDHATMSFRSLPSSHFVGTGSPKKPGRSQTRYYRSFAMICNFINRIEEPRTMTPDIPARIWQLEAREEIRELMSTYALRIIGAEKERIAELFTEDGVFEIKSAKLRVVGMDALRAFYRRMEVGASYPMPHLGIITIQGDVAQHVGSMDNPAHNIGRSGYCGIYRDELRKVNGNWLFAVRSFEFLQGAPPSS